MIILSWLLLIIGAITVIRGVRSRVGTDLFCPSCRHNVTGTWPDVDTCQECGKSIPKKRIVHGERVIWNKRVQRGGVIASLGIAGLVAAVFAARMGRPVYTWYPPRVHQVALDLVPNRASLQGLHWHFGEGNLNTGAIQRTFRILDEAYPDLSAQADIPPAARAFYVDLLLDPSLSAAQRTAGFERILDDVIQIEAWIENESLCFTFHAMHFPGLEAYGISHNYLGIWLNDFELKVGSTTGLSLDKRVANST